jgi:hypothetical protein
VETKRKNNSSKDSQKMVYSQPIFKLFSPDHFYGWGFLFFGSSEIFYYICKNKNII